MQDNDAYKKFGFRIKWKGKYVAGVSSVSGPGQLEFEPITLERGITHDTEFEQWAKRGLDYAKKEEVPKNLPKDIVIELYNEAGNIAVTYSVFRCWVSEYQALPELDANSNAVAFHRITLQNEGWARS